MGYYQVSHNNTDGVIKYVFTLCEANTNKITSPGATIKTPTVTGLVSWWSQKYTYLHFIVELNIALQPHGDRVRDCETLVR